MTKNSYPYAMKTRLTIIIRNPAGLEEKRVHESYFHLDESAVKEPWFVLKNYLAPRFAVKQYGVEGHGWVRIEEAKIIEVLNKENPSEFFKIPVRVMTFNQLKAYSDLKELGFDPYEFPTVEFAREMMQLRLEDPTGYEVQLALYREKHESQNPEFDNFRRGDVEDMELDAKSFESIRKHSEDRIEDKKQQVGASRGKRNKKIVPKAEEDSDLQSVFSTQTDEFSKL